MLLLVSTVLTIANSIPELEWSVTSPKEIARYLSQYHQTTSIAGAKPCPNLTLDLCNNDQTCLIVQATCGPSAKCPTRQEIKCVPSTDMEPAWKSQIHDAPSNTLVSTTTTPAQTTTSTFTLPTPRSSNICIDKHTPLPDFFTEALDQMVLVENNIQRIHISPDQRKLKESAAYCEALGLALPVPQKKERFSSGRAYYNALAVSISVSQMIQQKENGAR